MPRPTVIRVLRADPWLALAMAAACAIAAAPVLVGDYLPVVDLPGHAGLSSVLLRHLQGLPTPEFTVLNWPMPYSLIYWMLAALQSVVSGIAAVKVMTALAVVAMPLAVMRFLASAGRDPRMAVLVAVLAWDSNVSWGFTAFSLGMALAWVALAQQLDARGPQDALRGVPTVVLLALTHAQAAAFFALGVAVIALTRTDPRHADGRNRWQVLQIAAIGWATLLVGMAPWLASSVGTVGPKAPPKYHFLFPEIGERVHHFVIYALDSLAGDAGYAANIAACLACLLVPVLLFLWQRNADKHRQRWPDGPICALGVVCLALYVALPLSIEWPFAQAYVYARHASGALLAPVLLFAVRLDDRRVFAAVVALCFGVCGVQAGQRAADHRVFSQATRPFFEVTRQVPDGAKIAYFCDIASPPAAQFSAWWNLDGYLLADRAISSYTLWDTAKLPVSHRGDRPPLNLRKTVIIPAVVTEALRHVDFMVLALAHPEKDPLALQGMVALAANGPFRLYAGQRKPAEAQP